MKPHAGVSTLTDWQRANAFGLMKCRYCLQLFKPMTPQQTITCGTTACKLAHGRVWQKKHRAKVKEFAKSNGGGKA